MNWLFLLIILKGVSHENFETWDQGVDRNVTSKIVYEDPLLVSWDPGCSPNSVIRAQLFNGLVLSDVK